MMRTPITPAAFACLALTLATGQAAAQPQQVKPPIAQYWIDLSTHNMAGMPDMPAMAGIPGMPGMPGAGGNSWGMARGMALGRHMDLALYTRAKPSGSEAAHAIPPGVKMGPSLPLVPVQRIPTTREPGEPTEETPTEKPTGRLLIYWGCGETVRPGQPRVIDLAGNPAEMGRALGGRYAPDRGARATPGYSLWPNERSRGSVPRDASIVGEHAITGEGVPAGMRFAIDQTHDLMPAIELASTGALSDSVALKWQPVRGALAHYLHAMGSVGNDMVLWSSSEAPDTGMGLFDYLGGATIDKWVREKVLLPAGADRLLGAQGHLRRRQGRRRDAPDDLLRPRTEPRPPAPPQRPAHALGARLGAATAGQGEHDGDARRRPRNERRRDTDGACRGAPAGHPAGRRCPRLGRPARTDARRAGAGLDSRFARGQAGRPPEGNIRALAARDRPLGRRPLAGGAEHGPPASNAGRRRATHQDAAAPAAIFGCQATNPRSA